MGNVDIVSLDKILPEIGTSGLTPVKKIAEGKGRVFFVSKWDPTPKGRSVGSDSFLEAWIDYDDSEFEEIRGQVLVDLGAANFKAGYLFALKHGAKAYIGIEPFVYMGLYLALARLDINGDKIPASIANDDMLTFLKRLPDNSVSILTSGIDNIVIKNEDYISQTSEEIFRTLSPNGAHINLASFNFDPHNRLSFKCLHEHAQFYKYTKKKLPYIMPNQPL